jgi:hypothetical protein
MGPRWPENFPLEKGEAPEGAGVVIQTSEGQWKMINPI